MAGGDEFFAGKTNRAVGGLLFIAAATNAMDAYSALNSSPWTAESFGGDPDKARSCRRYVMHSVAVTSFYGLAAGIIAASWWPIVGTLVANVYMYYLYSKALQKAGESGSTGWDSPGKAA
jgi:hypothetical protein